MMARISIDVRLEKDPCSPNPCVNGLCSEMKLGIAACNCTEGWAGDLCERKYAVKSLINSFNNITSSGVLKGF